MIIHIDTTAHDLMKITLEREGEVLATSQIPCQRDQAEKLLPEIGKIMKKNKLSLKDLKGIKVENQGGSFTSLRIGVATANALGYALRIPVVGAGGQEVQGPAGFSVVHPEYDHEPDIGQ